MHYTVCCKTGVLYTRHTLAVGRRKFVYHVDGHGVVSSEPIFRRRILPTEKRHSPGGTDYAFRPVITRPNTPVRFWRRIARYLWPF